MDLTWIQTFLTAVEEKNLHRTAERLHLSQPTVTSQIQKLEQWWGVQLFERTGRGVQLTRAGQRFSLHAKSILKTYLTGMEDMAQWQQGYNASLRLAASPVLATTYLPRWVQGFTSLYPNVELSVQVVDSNQILPLVLSQEVDFGLSRTNVVHPFVQCKSLYPDPVVLVAPRDEYDFEGPLRGLTDLLENFPLFTHHHPEYWDKLLIDLRLDFPGIRTIQVSQGYVALEWVAEGLGISFFSASTVRKALLRGVVEQVPFSVFKLPTTYTYLVLPQNASPLVNQFLEAVRLPG